MRPFAALAASPSQTVLPEAFQGFLFRLPKGNTKPCLCPASVYRYIPPSSRERPVSCLDGSRLHDAWSRLDRHTHSGLASPQPLLSTARADESTRPFSSGPICHVGSGHSFPGGTVRAFCKATVRLVQGRQRLATDAMRQSLAPLLRSEDTIAASF